MGVFDNLKGKATEAAGEHNDKIDGGLDKAGDMIDEKTGGQHGDKIDKGVDMAKDRLDGMGGQQQ